MIILVDEQYYVIFLIPINPDVRKNPKLVLRTHYHNWETVNDSEPFTYKCVQHNYCFLYERQRRFQ